MMLSSSGLSKNQSPVDHKFLKASENVERMSYLMAEWYSGDTAETWVHDNLANLNVKVASC